MFLDNLVSKGIRAAQSFEEFPAQKAAEPEPTGEGFHSS